MSKLEDIRFCHVCHSSSLFPVSNVPIPDYFSDEEMRRDVLMCDDCETLHYVENGEISYEFSCKINESISIKKTKKVNE